MARKRDTLRSESKDSRPRGVLGSSRKGSLQSLCSSWVLEGEEGAQG